MAWVVENPDWLALYVSIIGFGFTLYLVRKAQGTAEAARDATNGAIDFVRQRQLTSSAQRLHAIGTKVDDAVAARKDGPVVLGYLNEWREEAMRLAGVMGTRPSTEPGDGKKLPGLLDAVRVSGLAVDQLVEGAADVMEVTREARRAMREAVETIMIMGASVAATSDPDI